MIHLPWVNKVVIVFFVDQFFPSACRTIMYERLQDGAHLQLQIYLANLWNANTVLCQPLSLYAVDFILYPVLFQLYVVLLLLYVVHL